MKQITLFVLCALLCACGGTARQEGSPLAGGDRDAHGCIASAGYTYSKLTDSCVRLWEDGLKLLPSQKPQEGQAVFAAYVLLSKDGAQAELFLPQGAAVEMTRSFAASSGPHWTGGAYRLQRTLQGWELYEGAKIIFAAPNPAAAQN